MFRPDPDSRRPVSVMPTKRRGAFVLGPAHPPKSKTRPLPGMRLAARARRKSGPQQAGRMRSRLRRAPSACAV